MATHKQITNTKNISLYLEKLRVSGLSPQTIKRKRIALESFVRFINEKNERNDISPIEQRITKGSKNPIQRKLLTFLPLVILLLLLLGVGYALFNQSIKNAVTNFAYPSSLTRPTRRLSFQGRLTDSSGNVITTPSNINFKLYNASVGGTELYTTGTGGTVVPDNNGIFSVVIGDQVGSEISSDVFTENTNVYLQITMNPATTPEIMTPRQQIATVGYALNSETLQGYPASDPAFANTIPVMDASGNINLGYTSPSLRSYAGTFGIEGQSVTINATDGSGGNLTLNPDSNGVLNLLFEGTTPSSAGFVNVSNANMTTGNVMSIRINNDNRNYDFLNFQSYNVGTTALATRFRVGAGGNTDIGGSLTLSNSINTGTGTTALFIDPSTNIVTRRALGDLAFQNSTSLSWYLAGNSGSTQQISVGDTASLNGTNGITTTASATDTLGIALGGNLDQDTTISNNSYRLSILGSGTSGLTVLGNGRIGIGTSAPVYNLHVSGDALISTRLGIGATDAARGLFVNANGIGVSGNSSFSSSVSIGSSLSVTSLLGNQLVLGGGSGNLTSLAVGTSGQFLMSNGAGNN